MSITGDWQDKILQAAAEGDLRTLQELARKHGEQAFLVTNFRGQTALSWASEKGRLEVVEYILSQPEGLNSISVVSDYGRTPLLWAAREGHSEVVKHILSHPRGLETISFADHDGRTSLHAAAMNGKTDCLKLLLDASPEPQKLMAMRDKEGETALHDAASRRYAECCQHLLVACPNAQAAAELMAIANNAGDSAVHVAVEREKPDVLYLLLAVAGSDVLAQKNSGGQTALALAESSGNATIRECFKDADAGALIHSVAQQGKVELLKHIIAVKGAEALALADQQGRPAWQHLVQHCGQRPKGLAADLLASIAETVIWTHADAGDVKSLESWEGKVLIDQCKLGIHSLRRAGGQSLIHLAALKGDAALILWVVRHIKPAQQQELLQSKDDTGKSAMDIARQGKHTHVLQLLWGEGVGAGDADDARSDEREVCGLRWCTSPIRTFSAALHSFVVVAVNSREFDAQESYSLEKCYVEGRSPIVVSYWDEAYKTKDTTVWAELSAEETLDGLSMANLIEVAEGTGEYTGSSQCHHCALAVFNACAKPQHRRQNIPNPVLTEAVAWLNAIGITTDHLRSSRAAASTSCVSVKDVAQEEIVAKAKEVGEALVEAVSEDVPVIRNIVSAGKKLLDRFRARREVAEAIQALWQELQWLESNKPSDDAARKTLDATLKAAAAELEDPALLFMRPDAAVQRVKGITEQVKSTCAKVESLKIEAIYRLMLEEQQRVGTAQAQLGTA